MKKDEFKTEVVFRKWRNSVIALFPYEAESHIDYDVCSSYMHVGQHGAACYEHIINSSKPAKESDFNDLKTELESEGYNLTVIHKRNRNKAISAFNQMKAKH